MPGSSTTESCESGVGVVLSLADARRAHLMMEGQQPRPKGKIVLGDAAGVTGDRRPELISKEATPCPYSLLPLSFPIRVSPRRPQTSCASTPATCLFNHSLRVYLFAAEQGRQRKLRFDTELLYIAAAFHDLGLTRKFSSDNERFEVDGANAARQFLSTHNIPEEQVRTVWEAIALHTTPGITHQMQPEVALLYTGVGLDVLGKGVERVSCEGARTDRRQVSAQELQG